MGRSDPGAEPRKRQRRGSQAEGAYLDRGAMRGEILKPGGNARRTLKRSHTLSGLNDIGDDLSKTIPGNTVRIRHEPPLDWPLDINYRHVKGRDVRQVLATLLARVILEEDEGGEEEKRRQKSDKPLASHPEIWRTVIRHRGSRHSPETYHHSLSKNDYENIERCDASPAFEMRKHVLTIHPFGGSSNPEVEPPRNPVLGYDIVDHVISEQMIIRSPQLLRAIKDVVHWPSAAFYDGQKRLTLNSPFRSIGVHRSGFSRLLEQRRIDLQNAMISNRSEPSQMPEVTNPKTQHLQLTVRHLELFLAEVDKVQALDLKLEEARHLRRLATFDMLWMLFKPGVKVHMAANGPNLACIIELLVWNRGTTRADSTDGPYEYVDVQMWYWDHDGM